MAERGVPNRAAVKPAFTGVNVSWRRDSGGIAMGAAGGPAFSKLTAAPIERRERRPVCMRGHVARGDGTTAEILVVDLSYEGCGIEVPLGLDAGETVTLSILRRGAIEADVRWCEGGKAGLVFKSGAEPAKQQRKRISARTSLSADVILRRLGKANFRVNVTDLSPHGCKVELVDRPSVGEHVLVKFDRLELLEAEVCWVESFQAGLRFEHSIHPAVFDLLVERLG